MVDRRVVRPGRQGTALAAALVAIHLLAACASLGPDTREPALDLPVSWPSDVPPGAEGSGAVGNSDEAGWSATEVR